MHITFVKKVLSDGSLCMHCETIFKQLIADGLIDKINHVAIADARDKQSPGMLLAQQYNVKQVPFFLVEDHNIVTKHTDIIMFDVYSEFKQFLSR